jgi:hypothetical protein
VPENVTIVSNTSTEISFNCKVGFNLTSGDLHIECVNNTWEGDIPTCSSKSRNLTCICIFVGNGEMGVNVVVMVWLLNLQLPIQSVPLTL